MGGFALDAAGTAHWSQKLKIIDVALSPGDTCAGIIFDCLLDTEQRIFEGKNTGLQMKIN